MSLRADEKKKAKRIQIRRMACITAIVLILSFILSVITQICNLSVLGPIGLLLIWVVAIASGISTVIMIIALFVVIVDYLTDIDLIETVKDFDDDF